TLIRALAVEEGNQLVRANLEVAEVQPLYAPLEQRFNLARGIQVIDHFLLIDLQLHGIERKEVSGVHRQEYRHLGVGRKQQLLLQQEQVLVQIDHVLLQALDVLVKAARVGRGLRLRGRLRS